MKNLLLTAVFVAVAAIAAAADPIQALMVTGGCCHDYPNQKEIISQGVSERANVRFATAAAEHHEICEGPHFPHVENGDGAAFALIEYLEHLAHIRRQLGRKVGLLLFGLAHQEASSFAGAWYSPCDCM